MTPNIYSKSLTASEITDIHELAGPILIFGASGFIGANIFLTLSQHRSDVYGCSRNIRNNWRFKNYHSNNLINSDITNYANLIDLIINLKPKTVFNLSSYGGHFHQTDREKIHQINYMGTLNLTRILSTLGCKAFVQAGSSSEYGLNCAGPREDDQLSPNSDYGVSKVGASYLIKYYGQTMGLPAMHLRLYSIYGPWQERQTLMPILISKCLDNKWPNLVNRNMSHDFVHIDDCSNAFVKAALSLYGGKGVGRSINIATGIKTTTEDLVNMVKKIINIYSIPEFGSLLNKDRDMPDWYGNPELAFKLLGWRYKTSLEDGFKSLFEWEIEFKKTA